MSYEFTRAAAYYSPLVGGVVDFPIKLRLHPVEGSWSSPCGTKTIHDAEVIQSLLEDGSLVEVKARAARTVPAVVAAPPAPAEPVAEPVAEPAAEIEASEEADPEVEAAPEAAAPGKTNPRKGGKGRNKA